MCILEQVCSPRFEVWETRYNATYNKRTAGTATTFGSRIDPETGYTDESLNTTDLVESDQSQSNVEAGVLALGEQLTQLGQTMKVTASWGVTTALAFGFSITVLAYATSHISGGQLNPAVTFSLALARSIPISQAIANTVAQIVGAILGSGFLYGTIPEGNENTLGSNIISPGVGFGNALLGEIVMTCVLCMVVLETGRNKHSAISKSFAPLAIGFAVFCAHAVLLPIDGCSINPARSLGPAIVTSTWPSNFWVFVVGPYIGAFCAIFPYLFFGWDFEIEKYQDPINIRTLIGKTKKTLTSFTGSEDV